MNTLITKPHKEQNSHISKKFYQLLFKHTDFNIQNENTQRTKKKYLLHEYP